MGKSKKVRIVRTLLVSHDDSSVIGHVGYDPDTNVLEVGIKQKYADPTDVTPVGERRGESPTFVTTRYRYKRVSTNMFLGLLTAKSMGVYFNTVIKPRYVAYRLPR